MLRLDAIVGQENAVVAHERPRAWLHEVRRETQGVASMKLHQGQVWKQGDQYLRIVYLGRLEVEYKAVQDLAAREGIHHRVSKKEFCRLIKHANLLTPAEIQTTRSQ